MLRKPPFLCNSRVGVSIPFICRFDIPSELEIKNTTECSSSAPYLDISLKLDAFTTLLYDKLDNLNLYIVNFPDLCSNIRSSPVYYSVYILVSQLIRYARPCSTYDQFLIRISLLTTWCQRVSNSLAYRQLLANFTVVIARQYNLLWDQMLSDTFHTNR
jgi:hypothetical protein